MEQVFGRCLIDGQLVEGARRAEVRNPADVDEVVGTYPLLGAEDVDRAVEAARKAQVSWQRVPALERAELVRQSSAKVDAVDGITELIVREQGKVLWEATFERGYYEALAESYADYAGVLAQGTTILDDALGTTTLYREPVGVAAAFTPWNYPLGLAAMKVVPALIAGCSVIVKPSPVTPLSTLEAFAALADHFPPGLVNVLTGADAEVSAPLMSHPGIRKISLTGSTVTGRLAASSAAATLKNVTLELGGNDAALLLDDVTVDDDLIAALIGSAFATSGQVCVAIKRVYVPRHLMDAVVDGLVAELEQAVVGNGLAPETTMGPLTTQRQREIITNLLTSAETAGAKVRRCGKLAEDTERGYFLRPAIVTDTPESHPLVQQEQFGPALPVQPYDDLDQAIELVNATELGLTSSVWTSDVERGARTARLIEAGTVHVNNHGLFAMDPRVCFGGVKQSGLGREMGVEGLLAYTEQRVVNTRTV